VQSAPCVTEGAARFALAFRGPLTRIVGRMERPRWPGLVGLTALAAACLASLTRPAQAAPTTTGFALDRLRPAEAGSDWFANESLDLRGAARPALALVADVSYRPLVLFGADGEELLALIDGQFFYHVNASLVLGRRVRLSASLPLLVYSQGGEGLLGSLGEQTDVPVSSRDGSGIGDARFAVDLRLVGVYGGPVTMAIGARVYAATGNEAQFTSDGRPRFEGRWMWAGQPGWFSYAAYVGVLFHGEQDDFAGVPFGTDLTFGAAVGLNLARGSVHLGPEVYGESVVSDGGEGFLKRASTPVEAAFGAKFRLAEALRLGAAVGRGLTAGIGAAEFRFMASLDFSPRVAEEAADPAPEPARDLDGDGVNDAADACPSEPGPVRSLDRGRNGCPDPGDRDGDGITDDVDACPDRAGVPSGDAASHGCVSPDRDSDSVPDTIDACPDTPGVQTSDPLRSGCPADSDSDGIDDALDACPEASGARSPDPKSNGCPKARLEQGEIRLSEQVQFATSSARILPESDELLAEVAQILEAHPEIELLSVEGHTDNSGSEQVNEKLSRDRALAVVMRLVERGISARRLTAKGYGSAQPIDDNATVEGRKNNRRVEFKLQRLRVQVQRLP
jgi:OOP family OmpA-OmpF porin